MDLSAFLQVASILIALPSGLLALADYRARRRPAIYTEARPAPMTHGAPSPPPVRPRRLASAPPNQLTGAIPLSFPRRLLATLVDGYGTLLTTSMLAIIISGDDTATTAAYEAALVPTMALVFGGLALWMSASGRSPGKLLVGGRLVRYSNGANVGFARSLWRLVLAVIVPFSLWVALGNERRTVHDRLTDTVVIRTRLG